jgi:multidrug resistance efflux pump
MVRKYLLPVLAVGMLLFAVLQVVKAQQTKPKLEPPVPPSQTPYDHCVAGAGLVEAQTENISVGAYLPGVVTRVHVKVGQRVQAGDRLFELDDRQLKAELKAREAALVAAQAQLEKLDQQPRREELPASAAKVRAAEVNAADQRDQLQRAEVLYRRVAIGEEEMIRRRMADQLAQEQLHQARADDALLRAGAWEPDKAIARAAVAQAEAQLVQTRTDLERLTVTALVAGEVLQVNVRPGEYVGTPPGQALIVLGSVQQLHVRVDIDEHDIPRWRPEGRAVAQLRGDPGQRLPLRFVRVEPYVIPKKSLTGDNSERVDTRVLQAIYALDNGDVRVYVGQQMDVFIEGDAALPGRP